MKERIVTTTALFAVAALLLVCGHAAATAANSITPQVRVNCFPATEWSASIKRLPCTTLVRPDNDRVRVIQGTTDRELAECVVNTANINDARCHRVPPARAADPGSITPTIAPPGLRVVCSPLHVCAVIGNTQEDGSVSVTVYVHMHAIEACELGNPREERGRYRAPCYRPTNITGPTHPNQP
jgi:hypothetical protein